jgi:hypothetical protein
VHRRQRLGLRLAKRRLPLRQKGRGRQRREKREREELEALKGVQCWRKGKKQRRWERGAQVWLKAARVVID